MKTLVIPTPEKPRCDFCSNPDIHTTYDAPDLELGQSISDIHKLQTGKDFRLVSEGEWYSCEPCSQLVDAGEWEKLTARAMEAYVKMFPESKPYYNMLYRIVSEDYQKLKGIIRRSS
jgi:hypothetical protein